MSEKREPRTQSTAGNTISPEMQAYLETQIEADERVLWVGTTHISARMRRLIPVVVMCLFMMFFCSGIILLMDNPSELLLIVLSLLLWAGLPTVIVWGQLAHLRRTLYAITDQRALIMSVGKPKRTESYPPEKIEFVQPTFLKEGRGDVYFTVLRGKGRQRMSFKHGFLAVDDVKYVAELMRRTFPT